MTMHNHLQLIQDLYTAFQQKDAEGMRNCYHPECRFSDSVFSNLNFEETTQMWAMLIERGKDLEIKLIDKGLQGEKGWADWEANYTFSATRRKIHNKIQAHFEFRDGKIFRHTDQFSFYTWAKQAFGWQGYLLGWTPFFKRKVQQMAGKSLEKYRRMA
jgi:ketosteroid isomerase-like protein